MLLSFSVTLVVYLTDRILKLCRRNYRTFVKRRLHRSSFLSCRHSSQLCCQSSFHCSACISLYTFSPVFQPLSL